MPVAFSQHERDKILAALQQHGRTLFATHGVRKTSVEELTRAAGISKGAFYLFYDSKEALYFDLLEQFEASTRAAILTEISTSTLPAVERMRHIVHYALTVWRQNALFTRFSAMEYEHLMRKLPPERVAAHLASDTSYAADFVAAWQAAGVPIAVEPALVAGLLRSLFVVSIHQEELEQDVYPQVVDTLVALVAQHLVGEKPA